MRYSVLLFSAVISLLVVSACGDGNNSDVRKDARQSLGVQEQAASGSQTPPTLPEMPPARTTTTTNVSGLNHYICPNNCEGSGGASQVNCPVCGTQYVHNAAFHNQAQNTTTQETPSTITPTQPAATAGPNAAGEWHYTCPSGCEGGSGSQGTCASCGAALAHNQAFHN